MAWNRGMIAHGRQPISADALFLHAQIGPVHGPRHRPHRADAVAPR